MLIKDILKETPLPADWDKEVYKHNVSFAKQLKYATERATKLGQGSSRVAFEIEFQGRPTILKIAKNKKGLAQNEFESELFNDWYFRQYDFVIPIIDYDEANPQPRWIHTEKAEKMTIGKFRKFSGGLDINTLINYALDVTGNNRRGYKLYNKDKIDTENEFVSDFVDFVANYHGTVMMEDFAQKANWGIYRGRPVIIDFGLSPEIYKLHYSRKMA